MLPGSRAPLRAYLTPIIADSWFTSPYLHDGSAPTLSDVVRPCSSSSEDCCNPVEGDCAGSNTGRNIDDQHGRTSHLSEGQLNDLVAFLRAPHGAVANLPAPPPAETLAPPVPPTLPSPGVCEDPPVEIDPVGEPVSLQVSRLVLELQSVGFTIPADVDGLVIRGFADEDEGVFQLDGSTAPKLTIDTPAGPGTIDFADRLFGGTIDHDTGEVTLQDVQWTLVFLPDDPAAEELCYTFDLQTGMSVFELDDGAAFTTTGEPFDDETGAIVLAQIILGPPSALSPPLVTAIILEGTLLIEEH